MYEPKPIDTSKIMLEDDILELANILAKNTHEVWAKGRINEGWIYGKKRDDIKKTHPCLIPFEKLTESEKSYDLNTSLETLKLIKSLGYKITKEDK